MKHGTPSSRHVSSHVLGKSTKGQGTPPAKVPAKMASVRMVKPSAGAAHVSLHPSAGEAMKAMMATGKDPKGQR
jgi:hypothetical protein